MMFRESLIVEVEVLCDTFMIRMLAGWADEATGV